MDTSKLVFSSKEYLDELMEKGRRIELVPELEVFARHEDALLKNRTTILYSFAVPIFLQVLISEIIALKFELGNLDPNNILERIILEEKLRVVTDFYKQSLHEEISKDAQMLCLGERPNTRFVMGGNWEMHVVEI